MTVSIMWFRRDLRISDHPGLSAAVDAAAGAAAGAEGDAAGDGGGGSGGGAAGVAGVFVIDPALWGPAGAARRARLLASLRALDESMNGRLVVVSGNPVEALPAIATHLGAASVHVSADAGPYGRRRDGAVDTALRAVGARLVATGSPYAIGPGVIVSGSGDSYRVFTPFSRAWLRHEWPAPAPAADVRWVDPGDVASDARQWPADPDLGDMVLADAGEAAAWRRWCDFADRGLDTYSDGRERPAIAGTSGLSPHLKYGEIHPRTLLADLALRMTAAEGDTHRAMETFRSELCWREFYADVLYQRPETAREYYRPDYATMRYDRPGRTFEAWATGRTGFPFVDAGMRQLLAQGWMHNRLRMVTASFLVKDLHVEWQHGARHFMSLLCDGDLASNNHGWQWVAGSGTDAAPYFRVFNPVTQGEKFDPTGDYVRQFVPELRHLAGKAVHTPWDHPDGYSAGYPVRIVDHAVERVEALLRLKEMTS